MSKRTTIDTIRLGEITKAEDGYVVTVNLPLETKMIRQVLEDRANTHANVSRNADRVVPTCLWWKATDPDQPRWSLLRTVTRDMDAILTGLSQTATKQERTVFSTAGTYALANLGAATKAGLRNRPTIPWYMSLLHETSGKTMPQSTIVRQCVQKASKKRNHRLMQGERIRLLAKAQGAYMTLILRRNAAIAELGDPKVEILDDDIPLPNVFCDDNLINHPRRIATAMLVAMRIEAENAKLAHDAKRALHRRLRATGTGIDAKTAPDSNVLTTMGQITNVIEDILEDLPNETADYVIDRIAKGDELRKTLRENIWDGDYVSEQMMGIVEQSIRQTARQILSQVQGTGI